MAQKTLTAKAQLNITDVEKKVKRLNTLFNSLNKNMKGASGNKAVERSISNTYNISKNVSKTIVKINQNTKAWAASQGAVANSLKSSKSALDGFGSKLKSVMRLAVAGLNVKYIVDSTDKITHAQNKFNHFNAGQLGDAGYNADGTYSDATLQSTQATMDKMYASAQKVRVGYDETMKNVSKMITLAPDAFQGNVDNAIRFNEIMAETYALGGASQDEMATSMYQLTQALGAGTLAGDELRSVREGAPMAYKAIEEFVQGVWNTEESLKELGAQGKVTSDMVVAAIMNIGDKTDKAFTQTTQTFGQTWTQIKNAALKAFTPIGDKFRKILTDAVDNGLIEKCEKVFTATANVVSWAMDKIGAGLSWINSKLDDLANWVNDNGQEILNWAAVFGSIVLAVLTAIGIKMVATAIITTVSWMMANPILLAVIGALMLIFYCLYLVSTGAMSAADCVAWLIGIIGFLVLAIGLATNAVPVMIAGAVLIVIGIIVGFLDYILGAIYVAGATIWNIIAGIVNAIIQFLWTRFVEPWIGIIEWVLNVFNGGFNSFGDAVKNLLGNIISWFLSLGKVVTKIIDAIFGTNWTGGLNSLQNEVLSWGKNENAITLSREAPTVLNRISYTDAWNTGMSHGSAAQDWMGGLVDGLEGKLSLNGIGNKLNGVLGLDKLTDQINKNNTTPSNAYELPDPDELMKGVNNIDENTKVSSEDLSYLRDIANMEWKREFTTAEIRVEMNNNNAINGDSDLDGLVTKLSEKLYEELDAVANGVYA